MMKIFLLSLLFLASAFAQEFSASQMQSIQENLIKNGGFESGRSSFTLSNGTFTTESSVVFKGRNSLKVVASAQTPSIVQDSTLYAAQLADGVQGIVYARVKSNMALKLCARKAGVTSTVDCIDISNENKWALYKVPTILGGTSNGISIASSGSVTGTAYFDELYVGSFDITQNASTVNTQNITVIPSTNITSGNAFGAATTSDGSGLFSYNSGTGVFTMLKDADIFGAFTVRTNASGTGHLSIFINGTQVASADTVSGAGFEANVAYAKTVVAGDTVSFGYSSAVAMNAALSRFSLMAIEEVPTSAYSAQCGANCVETFSARVSTAGVVSEENSDFVNGNCVVTGTAVYTCSFNPSIFTVSPNCQCTPDYTGGSGARDCMASSINSSQYQVTLSSNGTVATNSFTISCQKQGADFVATKTIVGSFKEVDVSPGIDNPKTCHYVFGGAGSLSAPTLCTGSPCTEYYDSCNAIAAPTRGSTGIYSVTIADGTFAPSSFLDCQCEPGAPSNNCTSGMSGGIFASTAGGGKLMDVRNALSAGGSDGTAADAVVHLRCKGQAP